METTKTCPNCRKPLPPDVPLGLCPECLIKAGFPTGTEPGAAGEAAGARFVPPPVAEIAQLFPQLEILRLIGKGGMGAVYKARQPALDRFVALKVLPPAVASDPGFAERFNREARALARLNHPNIVAVHDFGKAGALHYLLMEFVDGANLREVERAGELTSEQALAIVPQICEALQFAHNEGIVHRDIKPENLLLDKKGRLKITDFGIAKMVGTGSGQQMLTGAKDVVGTPHYMAPEQVERPQAVDHRADIYSLGVVFYEMLTGELPLGKFPPPSQKVQVDVRLDEVVLHALEKEPSRRYQQVSQVKTDVETISGTPPPAAGFAAKGGPVPLLATASDKTTSNKAILPALLMAIFFGVFGAHRFYVGKIRTAFLQLGLWCGCVLLIIACATTGGDWQPTLGILVGFSIFGSVIWATIDWILIACKAFTDGHGRRMTHWLHPHNGDLKAAPSLMAGPPSTRPPGGAASTALTGPTPPPPTHEKTPVNGTGKIVAPAVGLMVAALWKLLSALTALFLLSGHTRWLDRMLGDWGIGSFSGMAGVSLVLFKVVPALVILFGAFQMLRLRSYAWALAAAILSIVACSLIGLPIGIWALIILLQADVRETFARATVSPPPRTGQWPLILAAGVGVVVIVTGLAAAVLLVREAKTHYGSALNATAISAPAAPESVNAAPVLPPVRIKAGSSRPFTDSEGNLWLADQGFAGGETTERSDHLAIANTKDPALYQSERYGMTSFSYPLPNGKYLVKLHFAETYDAIKGPGGRIFTFIVEGHEFKNFDVWASAGGAQRAFVETVNVEVTDGQLNIRFTPQQENPEINGIEILPAPPVPPVLIDSKTIIVPGAHDDSSKTLNISSQNGQVVIETTNGRLTADKVTLRNGSNNSITLTASKMHYVVAPSTPATPTPPTPPVQPVPPVPPASASTAMSSQPMAAGTPSKPQVHRTKILGPLTTTDAFQQDFNQTLPLSAKGQVRLDNVNGRVEIAGWDGNDVVIKALKHGKTQESVEATKINVAASPDEIAIHTEQPSSETGFSAIWSWFKNGGNNNATVDYAIQVPRHARLANISSVNGRVVIDDVNGDIEASTVNGAMQIQGAAGSLKLSTVNGRMATELVLLGRGQSVSLSGVNGQIDVTLPADADADVSASTVNGHITSEFPSLIVKKDFPIGQHLKGTLGHGGANVNVHTVNGGISIQRGTPATSPSPSANPNSAAEKAATAAAQAWLSLIDEGQYSGCWNEAEAYFQKVVTETNWETSMETFRKPLGNLLSRNVKSAQFMTEMPGAPDGQYVVMQFDSSFTEKKSTIETVTFKLENDGKWKASGYFIK
jgi:TM2 domain-containing membrane protein YozV/predicted Ser/Thr protein kinase